MPAIVEFPTVVQEALVIFGDLFDTEPARRHFAEYLTGLIVAENKTVSGINREFALTTDQSCLNRWLTEVEWDVTALHDRRLAWLQQAPQTRYSGRGVIAIDNTLVTHEGKLIEDVGWFWDHADQRHVIAHDYIISNYVCPSRAHYPIEWRRFKKRDTCTPKEFKDHTQLCMELIDDALKRGIPGAFTFDSYFTSAKVLNHIQSKQAAYVGDLKLNRHVYLVSVAYSLLMRSLQQHRAQDWARRTLTTIGEACRAVKTETLARMIDWVVEKLTVDHGSVTDIKAVVAYS